MIALLKPNTSTAHKNQPLSTTPHSPKKEFRAQFATMKTTRNLHNTRFTKQNNDKHQVGGGLRTKGLARARKQENQNDSVDTNGTHTKKS